jgi:hypothetical protein
MKVLDREYQFSPDFPAPTQRILQSITDFGQIIPLDSIRSIITPEVWQQRWRKKCKDTSSSVSKLHFRHYIAGSHSPVISSLHTLKTSLSLYHGVHLTSWSWGLCIMLDKLAGMRLIMKLRAILLMEADFNAMNKIVLRRAG